MAEQTKPCDGCPWVSKEPRDVIALTAEVRTAAKAGQWFCCHVQLGTCWGAVCFGAASNQPDLTSSRRKANG